MTDVYRKTEYIRRTGALSASGAYSVSEPVLCLEYDYFTLLIDYERQDAAGAVTFYIELSLDKATWYRSTIFDGGAVSANSDTTSNIQREAITYGGTDAVQEFFVYGAVEIDQFAKYIRVAFAESGAVSDPGDCGATLVLTRRKQKTMN